MNDPTANWHERAAAVSAAERIAEKALEEGGECGAQLLSYPPSAWRKEMRAHTPFRSYGTLRFLLGNARSRWENEPTIALQITTAVLEFVDEVDGPSRIHEIGLRGLARKEHANACEATGDLPAARAAAEDAVRVYSESSALLFDQTRARLVECKVLRELGEIDAAMKLARECAKIFEDFGNLEFAHMARMFEAGSLFSAKQFTEASAIFVEVMTAAELRGDGITVARCLQNAAQCARELRDFESARALYYRALDRFEAMNVQSDANCCRWGLGVTLGATGKVRHAISELFKVRAVFLSLGMNRHAACAALDIVRFEFDSGIDVRATCSELVPLFTNAGLTQNAIEALAYIREQAAMSRLTAPKIRRVRTYFEELLTRPMFLFKPPLDEEEG